MYSDRAPAAAPRGGRSKARGYAQRSMGLSHIDHLRCSARGRDAVLLASRPTSTTSRSSRAWQDVDEEQATPERSAAYRSRYLPLVGESFSRRQARSAGDVAIAEPCRPGRASHISWPELRRQHRRLPDEIKTASAPRPRFRDAVSEMAEGAKRAPTAAASTAHADKLPYTVCCRGWSSTSFAGIRARAAAARH